MSKFFLDMPRDKLFDSNQSISFKSSIILPSEAKYSQGLLLLNSFLSEKKQKKSSFITWKYYCQKSLYSLWKDIVKDEPNLQEFEVILKILHKRKAEVDNMWGMIKKQEEIYEQLLEKNKILESKNNNIQKCTSESSEKSIQVNFLQDSMLRRTHIELEQLEKSLILKEKQLESLEYHLIQKSDQLNTREKLLHQKEVNNLFFNEIDTQESIEAFALNYKSQIFPEYIEDNLWLQLVSPSSVSSEQLYQLQEYEKALFCKHEKMSTQMSKILEDIQWIASCKEELAEREAKVVGLEALKEQLEKEREELRIKYDEIVQATEAIELQLIQAKGKKTISKSSKVEWGLANYENTVESTQKDTLDYLKIGLEELSELSKKGIIEENLTEVLIESIIRFGENLVQREIDFKRIYQAKSAYLENCKTEYEELKKILQLEESLVQEDKQLEQELEMKICVNKNIQNLEIFKDIIFERQLYGIDNQIMEIEKEEMEIKKLEYENEFSYYNKLNLDLQQRIDDYDNKIFEIKTILQLLSSVKPGNIEIFKQEISRILMKHNSNPETNNKLKIIMTIYLWLSKSFNMSYGKHQLLAKLSFYLLRIRALMLKQGFSVAPVYFSTPSDFMWIEVFWLRTKHYYLNDLYVKPELVSITKHWFTKFIIRKMASAFNITTISYKKMLRNAFYKMRNKCIENDKKKTQCLYSQLMRVKEKSVIDIRKDVNVRAACRILPLFERFNKFWILYTKIHLLKWKNYSARIENLYYQNTIYDFYSNLSELMHKEHKFREECRINQNLLRNKINENNKLLDKILF